MGLLVVVALFSNSILTTFVSELNLGIVIYIIVVDSEELEI